MQASICEMTQKLPSSCQVRITSWKLIIYIDKYRKMSTLNDNFIYSNILDCFKWSYIMHITLILFTIFKVDLESVEKKAKYRLVSDNSLPNSM